MDGMVREFALQMLRKLQSRPVAEKKPVDGQVNGGTQDEDENMEDGQLPPEDLVQTAYLPERIELNT
jgi:symplekin